MVKKRKKVKPKELRSIAYITPNIADTVEAYFKDNMQRFSEEMGFDFTLAAVGGKFNRDRMVVEIGLLPTKAGDREIAELREDQHIQNTPSTKDITKPVKFLTKRTKLPQSKVEGFVRGWYNNINNINNFTECSIKLGSVRYHKGVGYRVIGFNLNKDKAVMWNSKTRGLSLITLTKLMSLEEQ